MVNGKRALDHFVILVRDLDAAGDAWTAAGFQVLPKMRHLVSGSANRVVQLGHNYVELLGDIDRMAEPFRSHYLPRFDYGEGLANICFTSENLEADRESVRKAGIVPGPVTSARRRIRMPNGAEDQTESDFFYPERPGHAFMSPFLAAHHKPETIFTPEYQRHPNTALDVTGVFCVSADPAIDAAFFATISGTVPRAVNGGVLLDLGKEDRVEILLPDQVRSRFGNVTAALPTDGAALAVGMTIRVASLAACRAALAVGGVKVVERPGELILPATEVCGAFLRLVTN